MSAVPLMIRWSVIGQSVRGASHKRSGAPNQDAIRRRYDRLGTPPIVLAVSDGHGSQKCFRSDRGARFAADIACQLTYQFLRKIGDSNPAIVKRETEARLPVGIVNAWRKKVDEDICKKPFTEEELARVKLDVGASARTALEQGDPQQKALAYGATLLLAAVGQDFAFFLQLGDGNILSVWDHTPQSQVDAPLPEDATLLANDTTSLCMPNAHRLFRFRFQYFQGVPPAVILLSTDGYANSFSSMADFYKVGSDLLQILRAEKQGKGREKKLKQRMDLEKNLNEWLEDASINGSGDDVTVGIIYRQDVIGSENQHAAPSTHSAGAAI